MRSAGQTLLLDRQQPATHRCFFFDSYCGKYLDRNGEGASLFPFFFDYIYLGADQSSFNLMLEPILKEEQLTIGSG